MCQFGHSHSVVKDIRREAKMCQLILLKMNGSYNPVVIIFFFDDRQVCKAVVKMYAVYTGKSLHTVCKVNV